MKIKILLMGLLFSNLFANDLSQSVDITIKANKNSASSQKKIDKMVLQKDSLYNEFKRLNREIESYKNYNSELGEIVKSQNKEQNSYEQQIEQIAKTQQEILPLIKKMLMSLEELLANDTPFLYEERNNRITRLKKLIKRSDVSVAAKYRAVIEAYEIENEYGRTIESYRDILNDGSLKKSVNFLRIGRIGFYYLSEDYKEAAIWDHDKQGWQKLDHQYIIKLKEAIKIASKKGVPTLLRLPMFNATEVAQ